MHRQSQSKHCTRVLLAPGVTPPLGRNCIILLQRGHTHTHDDPGKAPDCISLRSPERYLTVSVSGSHRHLLILAHELVEHRHGLSLGQDIGDVRLTSDEHQQDHKAGDIVAQTFSSSENVLGLLERYRVEREVDAALGVRENARRAVCCDSPALMTVRRAPKVRPKWIRQYRFSTNVQYLYKAQKVVYNVFLPSVDGTSLGSTANVIEIHSGGVFQPPYARLRTRHIQRLPSHCLPSTYQYIPVHTSYITHILTQAASAS